MTSLPPRPPPPCPSQSSVYPRPAAVPRSPATARPRPPRVTRLLTCTRAAVPSLGQSSRQLRLPQPAAVTPAHATTAPPTLMGIASLSPFLRRRAAHMRTKETRVTEATVTASVASLRNRLQVAGLVLAGTITALTPTLPTIPGALNTPRTTTAPLATGLPAASMRCRATLRRVRARPCRCHRNQNAPLRRRSYRRG